MFVKHCVPTIYSPLKRACITRKKRILFKNLNCSTGCKFSKITSQQEARFLRKSIDLIPKITMAIYISAIYSMTNIKSRKENPQKLTQLSSRSHPKHLVGKRTVQKDITIDTTSDSQVNSNFPNRWSPASLSFNNYCYLFLYLYIT